MTWQSSLFYVFVYYYELSVDPAKKPGKIQKVVACANRQSFHYMLFLVNLYPGARFRKLPVFNISFISGQLIFSRLIKPDCACAKRIRGNETEDKADNC